MLSIEQVNNYLASAASIILERGTISQDKPLHRQPTSYS
jgi:hypothetical protein